MDYDRQPPMPIARYREAQRVMPGVETLYTLVRATLESATPPGARLLLVGAGGGREAEALLPSDHGFGLVGVDPSADMLALVPPHPGRLELVQGLVEDLPADPGFDGATALLVMHFLPDDGAKLAFLRQIRRRLRPGAPLILADVVVEDRAAFARLAPVFERHAALVGVASEIAPAAVPQLARMAFEAGTMIPARRQEALFAEAGFRLVAPIWRGLWYAAWWLEAPADAQD